MKARVSETKPQRRVSAYQPAEVPSQDLGNCSPECPVMPAVAAKFLSMHPKTLLKKARRGELPAHPISDGERKQWLFLLSELSVWFQSRINSYRHPCPDIKGDQQC